MPQFQYTFSDANGDHRSGFIEAADEHAAREQLGSQGIIPDSLTEVEAHSESRDQPPKSRSPLTMDEHVEVIGQVGGLVAAGVPLSAGLRTLSEEIPSRRLSRVFDRLSEKIDRGDSLEDALKSESDDLPEWLAAVFAAGTRSGRLPECIQHFIAFSRMRGGLRAKLILSMVYPAILLGIGLAVCGALCAILIPGFRSIFEDFGVALPALTEWIFHTSRFVEDVVQYWPLSLLIFWASVLALYWGSRSVFGPAGVRRLVYQIPLIGRVFKLSALAEFSQLLALLIEARTPLHEALRLVGRAIRDPNLAEGAHLAATHIERGESFATLRGLVFDFPDELLRIPGWGSNDSTLVESLRVSSEVFALQSEISGRGLTGIITPFSVILAGTMIVLTVIGLFLPLVKLLGDLS